MSDQSLARHLANLNFNPLEQAVYIQLLKQPWSTVLQLARATNLKRPTLYRILEGLQARNLVETKAGDATTFYRVSDPHQLQSLITTTEQRLQTMKKSWQAVVTQTQLLQKGSQTTTNVQFHRGVAGLQALERQLCLPTDYTIYAFSIPLWPDVLGSDFAEEIRTQRVKQRITLQELLNPDPNSPFPHLDISNPESMAGVTNHEYLKTFYRARYLDPELFTIANELVITPTQVIFYHFNDEEPVGIEVISSAYAQMMKHFFETLWAQAGV